MKDKRCNLWHLISGIIMVMLGIFVWANPLSSLLAIAMYLGAALFILGCGYIVSSFTSSSGWYFVVGLLDILIGLILLTNLGLTIQTLPVIFALWLIASGAAQIYGSMELKKLELPWGWSMFSGILGIILGFLVLSYQSFGEFALILTIGFYIFAYGAISIAEYFYFRKYCKLQASETKNS